MRLSGKTYLQCIFLLSALSASKDAISQHRKNGYKGLVVDAKTGLRFREFPFFLRRQQLEQSLTMKENIVLKQSVPADKIVFSFIGYQTESRNYFQRHRSRQ